MNKANNKKNKLRVRGKGSKMLEERLSRQAMQMSMMQFADTNFDQQFNTGSSVFAANGHEMYIRTKQEFGTAHFD